MGQYHKWPWRLHCISVHANLNYVLTHLESLAKECGGCKLINRNNTRGMQPRINIETVSSKEKSVQ